MPTWPQRNDLPCFVEPISQAAAGGRRQGGQCSHLAAATPSAPPQDSPALIATHASRRSVGPARLTHRPVGEERRAGARVVRGQPGAGSRGPGVLAGVGSRG